MKIFYIFSLALLSYISTAQKTSIVHYSEQINLNSKSLKKIPESTRKLISSDMTRARFKTILSFNKDICFFYSTNEKFTVKEQRLSTSTASTKTYVDQTSIQAPKIKIYKSSSKNIIKKQSNGALSIKAIENVKWKTLPKTKKILNYNCTLATTMFNNKPLSVYFTKEIKGKASPSTYPFIDGVILEYTTPSRHGIATQVLVNQTDINEKEFFRQ